MRLGTASERRARLARRHHLAAESPAKDVTALAERLVGLHATDPSSTYLTARARIPGFAVAQLEAALYEDLTLVKHLCMRRTMFVLPVRLVPVVQAACTDAIAVYQRKRLVREVEEHGIAADGSRWLRAAEKATLAAIAELGEATGAQISKAVPVIQARFPYGEGKSWGGEVGVATRIYTILAAEGKIVRGHPGPWTSSRHRWRLADPAGAPMDELTARTELVRRWLAAFGPAQVSDVVWWTGLGVGKVRAALARLDTREVDLDGEQGVVLAEDARPAPPVEPWAAFLPGLDPTTMGWKSREWYLGAHGPVLFDTNGNAGPTVWWDGRIVGGWAQRKTREVVYEVLEDVGRDATAAIEGEAAALEAWLDAVVAPRFPTPLDRRLRG